LLRARRILAAFTLLLFAASEPARAAEPSTLAGALGLPDWLRISVEHRTRFEYLGDQFRTAATDRYDGMWAFRTLVHGEVTLADWLKVGAELQDSRQAATSCGTPITTSDVNTVELLRAYFLLSGGAPFGGTQTLQAGRITMDVGSRRLVARNSYRNTINAFTGLDWSWKNEEGRELRAFWTLPVQRRPRRQPRLQDNDIQFDDESLDLQFWGVFHSDQFPWGDGKIRHELFYFGLYEDDTRRVSTADRRLHTPGFRIFQRPAPSAFDFVIESAFQFGESRTSSTSTDERDHFAHFQHAEVGYSFDCPWKPRVALQYDYASGDHDPTDDHNGRFDTLFGARRFDFGPTGFYGPFARGNLNTPGIRLEAKPRSDVTGMVAYRGFWLAAKKDAWTTSGVVDPAGDSGRFIGQQLEFSLRWDVLPGNLQLETGYAHLFAGKFIDTAPNSNRQGDSDYVYTQATVKF
jgi:hypothetical protein